MGTWTPKAGGDGGMTSEGWKKQELLRMGVGREVPVDGRK
jgi:hypothetical protein